MPNTRLKPSSAIQKLALRRPLDYVTKPMAFFIAIMSMFVISDSIFFGMMHDHPDYELLHIAPVIFLTALPFVVASLTVVTRLDRVHENLAELALTDVLTGLPNRRSFTAKTDNLQAHGSSGFLLILDADHFKNVNDTYGHAVGDECLKAIADRLREVRRPHDIYGRIGGEEFGAYLPFTTNAELRKIGERLCKGIHISVEGLEHPLRLTMSVGATETHEDELVTAALQRADEALYVAKSTGRARMVTWTKSMAGQIA